jgi:hypothetical protein
MDQDLMRARRLKALVAKRRFYAQLGLANGRVGQAEKEKLRQAWREAKLDIDGS